MSIAIARKFNERYIERDVPQEQTAGHFMDVKGGFYALHPQFAIFPERFQAGGAQRTCECLEISVECHVGGKTFPVNGDLVDLANRLLKRRDDEL